MRKLKVKEKAGKGCNTCRYPKNPPKGHCTHPLYISHITASDECLDKDYALYRPLGNRKEK